MLPSPSPGSEVVRDGLQGGHLHDRVPAGGEGGDGGQPGQHSGPARRQVHGQGARAHQRGPGLPHCPAPEPEEGLCRPQVRIRGLAQWV